MSHHYCTVAREGALTELDLPETIRHTAHQGWLDLVTRRERLFGDDRRLAGSVAVVEGPEKLHVTATYVAPSPTTLK